MSDKIKILAVGGGGREHAIVDALVAGGAEVYCYMPCLNPGIKKAVKGYVVGKIDENFDDLAGAAVKYGIKLAVIGPEGPLAAGIVDELEKRGIACIGPGKKLAKLETSKSFTRRLLQKHGIDASPKFRIFDANNADRIPAWLDKLGSYAIKPDGLTGGKGVRIFGEHVRNKEEALAYCNELLDRHPAVVIEEKLEGEEFSLQTMTDGKAFLHFPVVQDHKKALEGDRGSNTGGMGSYSDANLMLPFLTQEDVEAAKRITEKTAFAIKQETGIPYKGVMFGGFIKTASGIKLLEYNARFGDPEAMNVLPLLKTNFVSVCMAVVKGRLGEIKPEFQNKASVCKYVVPEGYPENPRPGRITIPATENVLVYYASVYEKDGGIYTTTSRGVAFVGTGNSINEAERTAEEAASGVEGNVYHRRDIGTAESIRKRIEHVRQLSAMNA